MRGDHWTAHADRVSDGSPNPLWGLVAEDDNGDLLLPAWRNHRRDVAPDGVWSRPLNLRRPTHWLPYVRSRIWNNRLMMVERI